MPASTADLTALSASIAKSRREAPKVVDQVLNDAANKIMARMVQLAPKRTGRLAQSITIQSEPGRYTIGPVGVEYAVYQEYGTATRGEFGGQPYVIKPVRADKLTFQINGKWISTKMVIHPGIKAHPFARPAMREYIDSLPKDVADAVVKTLVD